MDLKWLQDKKSHGKIQEDIKIGSQVQFMVAPELYSIVNGLQNQLDDVGISNVSYNERLDSESSHGQKRLYEEYGTPYCILELNYPTGTLKPQLIDYSLALTALGGLCLVDPFFGVGASFAIHYMFKKWYDHVYYPKHKDEIKKERMKCADIGYKLVEDLISEFVADKELT
jgi:hypothetical protein